jgi:hypothetical protein
MVRIPLPNQRVKLRHAPQKAKPEFTSATKNPAKIAVALQPKAKSQKDGQRTKRPQFPAVAISRLHAQVQEGFWAPYQN